MSDSFDISYEAVHPGTEKTSIVFYPSIVKTLSKAGKNKPTMGIDNEPIKTATKERCIYVTDSNVAVLPAMEDFIHSIDTKKDALLILEAGEKYKTIESVLKILTLALEHNFSRSSCFVGIGGGVICDMTAFAASLFKRGAKLQLVPTTLLSMVDAAIGGKTGCDFNNWKNMVGTFYPASIIHICPDFVQSQSSKEFKSGLAEVLKTAMLYAPKLFTIFYTKKDAILSRQADIIYQLIKRSALAKARIVQHDLLEKNIRMQLNLGHTFGHAYESLIGLGNVAHGDAVAWGIGRAIELSYDLGYCEKEYRDTIFSVLDSYGWCTNPIPKKLESIPASAQKLIDIMKTDKKNSTKNIRLILQRELNSTAVEEIKDEKIKEVLSL